MPARRSRVERKAPDPPKAGAHHEVAAPLQDRRDQGPQGPDVMLAVPVELHGDVIPVPRRVQVSGLHRAPDAQVPHQGEALDAAPPAHALRPVGGAVVDDDVVHLQALYRRSVQDLFTVPSIAPSSL